MTVLLLHIDGKLPNLALMRLAAYYRTVGHVIHRRVDNPHRLDQILDDVPLCDIIYGSLIFERSRPLAERIKERWPAVILGGTGWSLTETLDSISPGLSIGPLDYTDYPMWQQSIGFTQRGCRLRCPFCVVPRKEGAVREEQTITEIWRGSPWPREIILLDNDFFGQPHWQQRISEIQQGRFKVNFNQGINARMLDDETAAALASVDYRNAKMTDRRLYTAWDNRKDEIRLFRGLEALVRHGVNPRHIMVYLLVGYWTNETHADRDYRRQQIRAFGAIPYPMPFVRTKELVGFQRWVIGAYDKRISWGAWEAADYQPRKLQLYPERHSAVAAGGDSEGYAMTTESLKA